jgi:predicted Zn-dependent protease
VTAALIKVLTGGSCKSVRKTPAHQILQPLGLILVLLLGFNASALGEEAANRCAQPRSGEPVSEAEAAQIAAIALPLWPSLRSLPAEGPNYLNQMRPPIAGWLLWRTLPLCVYIAAPSATSGSARFERERQWEVAQLSALKDWEPWFPWQRVDDPALADIAIERRSPPLRRGADGHLQPARTAETRFFLYRDGANRLQVRYRIDQGLTQAGEGLRGTARHELGHALGLWGHSTNPEDVMYPAQTGRNGPLSARDLATLRRLYEQTSPIGQPLTECRSDKQCAGAQRSGPGS